jgi:hypothetical protein
MATTKAQKPKYQVVDDVFVAQSEQGEIKIRLSFKTKLLRSIRDSGDEVDQIFALLDGLGDKKTSAQLDELDIFDTIDLVQEYFKAFSDRQNARASGSPVS